MSSPFDPVPPADIAGVLARFEAILDWARRRKSRLGYFAALYRGVTLGARTALAVGAFENPQAAERLVVIFAGRYFQAFADYPGGASLPRAWQTAFDAAGRWTPTVSQHLLLGINAHINLDLGIAAARTMAEGDLPKADFDRVNGLLLEMVDEVETKLAKVWPLLRLLDWLAGRLDEMLIGSSLRHARSRAWDFAVELRVPGSDEAALITAKDRRVAAIGRHIAKPGLLLRAALGIVRLGELRSVVGIIKLLEAETARAPVSVRSGTSHQTPPA